MGPTDALLHLANLFALPVGTALIASLLAKGAGGRALRAASFKRLAAWSSTAAVLAVLGGLVLEGREGRMLTYGVMVLLIALALYGAARTRDAGVSPRASAPRRARSAAARS